MAQDSNMIWAQISRDNFVPEKSEGKGGWCPKCGEWKEKDDGECSGCRKRKERWEAMQGHEETYLKKWLDECRDRKEILLQAYEQRRLELLKQGEWRGLLSMEQEEEEFAQQCKSNGKEVY